MHVSPVVRDEISTTDPELAHQWLVDTYTDHSPQLLGDPSEFRMQVSSVETNLFRIDALLHTMSVQTDLEPYRRLIINRVRGGRYRMDMAGRSIRREQGDVAVMDPLAPGRATWERLDIEAVALDLQATRAVGAGLSGLEPEQVRFWLAEPIDDARARYWTRTVDHLSNRVLADENLVAEPLIRAQAFRQLVGAALAVFPNSVLDTLSDPSAQSAAAGEPATVRRAVDFIDAHAQDDIDIVAVAEAARIGPRGLQAAFRRHRDQTPMEYLRTVRMAGAHRDLQAADPTSGDTVAVIAARWGFTHPGRFSVEYRRAQGRSPSRTLRE